MQEWVWEAKGRAGEVRKGVMEAATEAAVQERLKQQNLTPTKVKKKPKEINITFGSPVTEAELVVFIRQFATMIDAGLPLVQCLEILSQPGREQGLQPHPQGHQEQRRAGRDVLGLARQAPEGLRRPLREPGPRR
jgi:type II secretory pathway component PulF